MYKPDLLSKEVTWKTTVTAKMECFKWNDQIGGMLHFFDNGWTLTTEMVQNRVTKHIVYDIYKYLMTGGRSFDQPVTAARITITKLREHGGG